MSATDVPPTETEDAPPARAPAPRVGRAAARGMVWMSIAAGVNKTLSFFTNLVLGWLLTDDDFGLFALATSVSAIVFVMADGGAARLLRHPEEFRRLGRAVARLSLAFNALAALVLFAAAWPAGWFYEEPQLPWLMVVVAVALPLSNRPLILRTRMGADLRFRQLSQLNSISVLIRNVSMIGFALSGLGPMSFVIPLLVVNTAEWLILRRWVPGPIPGAPLDRTSFREIIDAARWIIFGLMAAALVNNGAPAIIRLFEETGVVGQFFFGFQVAVAPYVLFSGGLRSVLMPSMARLRDDPARQAGALFRAVQTLALVGAPVAIGAALIAPAMTRFLWQGRWDAAIPAIAILGLPLAFRLSGPIGGSLLEARGEWRLRSLMLWIDGLTTLAASALGAALGGLEMIALCFSAQRLSMGLAHCFVSAHRVSLPWTRIMWALLPSHFVAGTAGVATFLLGRQVITNWHPLLEAAFLGTVFAVLATAGAALFFRGQIRALIHTIGGRGRARPSPDAAPPASVE